MKMKSSMKLKAIMIITMLGMNLAGCAQAQNKDGTFASESGMEIQVDSMIYKNESRPVYYARYGNRGCLFELRINDNLSAEVTEPVNIGETSIAINPVIFKSGKQSISISLKPFPGRKTIVNDKPFRLEIGYYDFTEKPDSMGNRIWHKVFELPEIEIPEEGLPQIEIEKEFDAQVPCEITTWDEYVDLREIPNIEQKVVEEYKRVRQMIAEKKINELKEYFWPTYQEIGVTLYQSQKDIERNWKGNVDVINKYSVNELQPIEEYRMVFSTDGKSISLKSKKHGGFPAALLFLRDEKNSSYIKYGYIELHLSMKKGTNKLIPVMI